MGKNKDLDLRLLRMAQGGYVYDHELVRRLWSQKFQDEFEQSQKLAQIGGWGHDEERPAANSERLVAMLRMRLRLGPGDSFGFAHIHACEAGSRVHVFIVQTDKSEPLVLTDDSTLYPSDRLTTQIRLMRP